MASGDTLFVLTPLNCSPPSANAATLDTISDASTPNMIIPVLDFDGSAANEHMDWFVTIPEHYSETTGFTFSFKYAMDGTDGDAIELEFRALHIDDQTVLTGDLGMDGQTATLIVDDPDATANDFNYSIHKPFSGKWTLEKTHNMRLNRIDYDPILQITTNQILQESKKEVKH